MVAGPRNHLQANSLLSAHEAVAFRAAPDLRPPQQGDYLRAAWAGHAASMVAFLLSRPQEEES